MLKNRIRHIFAAMAEIEINGALYYAAPDFQVGAEIFDAEFNPLPDGTYGPYVVKDGHITEILEPDAPAEPEVEVSESTELEETPVVEETSEVIPEVDPLDEVRTAIQVLAASLDELKNQVIALDSRISDIEKTPADTLPTEEFHKASIGGIADAVNAIRSQRRF